MAIEWGYSQCNGPDTWAKSFPEAAGACQSPVDIKQVSLKVLETNQSLSWKYDAENAKIIVNTGFGWIVHVNGTGSELVGGPLDGKYVLEQFHCHWGENNDCGSEHTVNGQKFAAELHLVHWNATKYQSLEEAAKHSDGLCVIGVFLESGSCNSEFCNLAKYLAYIEYKGDTIKMAEPLDPNKLIPKNSGYYTYQGSLTTPPCLECVIWIVFKDPVKISDKQLEAFRNLKSYSREEECPSDDYQGFVKTNSRPTLPLGEREIKECRQ